MKISFLLVGILLTSGVANAQQVQMECRDLSSTGNVLGPDETLVNGMACHVVKPAKVTPPPPPVPAPEKQSQAMVQQPAVAEPPSQSSSTVPSTPVPVSIKIVSGARVYITPMDGFENYLAAALRKKQVPLVAVNDPNVADYVLGGTSQDKKAGWAKIVFMGNIHSDNSASVTMTDKKTGAIVFAYAVDKKSTLHGQQTTAEACAKHLKSQIEKDSK